MDLYTLPLHDRHKLYQQVLRDNDMETIRRLCREDLYFLLAVVCNRKDARDPWIRDRCDEVYLNPDGYIDLWAREHYKSTIISFAKTIQDILINPDITVGIFSHNSSCAGKLMSQIMHELESNEFLKGAFPEILYDNPRRDSPSWSIKNGITVKRKSNPKECTVEASGLVDGQPIGRHFSLLVYDDIVTDKSVSTPEQMEKTTSAWQLSTNLGAEGGRIRIIGTRYHYNDTYRYLLEEDIATPRIYPATDDGTMTGKPVFMSEEYFLFKRKSQGPYIFGCQMLQDPVADNAMGFDEAWLQYYNRSRYNNRYPRNWNMYLLVDPAHGKKKENDYTVMTVVALAPDNNYYLIAGLRDRLNLTERTNRVFDFVRKYRPKAVAYERYGLQSDIEHIEYVMAEKNYRFKIIEVGGSMTKVDRIRKLVPIFEEGRFYLPERLLFRTYDGKMCDFTQEFIKYEYSAFPVSIHDDMLDSLARILAPELKASFPRGGSSYVEGHQEVGYTNNKFDIFKRG